MKVMDYSEFITQKRSGSVPGDSNSTELTEKVRTIIQDIKTDGDSAVRKYTALYDGVELDRFNVDKSDLEKAQSCLDSEVVHALKSAENNITMFAKHQLQQIQNFTIEIQKGVWAGQRVAPIRRAAIYVPGGRFPLPSSALMGLIPAKIAGVKELYVFTPPRKDGSVDPAILAVAHMLDVKDVFRIGGVQAVAAAAFGTKSIPKMDIVVGPGNKYVTEAKRQVYGEIGVDFIAGPSEVVVVAEETANPDYIAADLLSQTEHDPDAVPVLVTTSRQLANDVICKVNSRLALLKNKNIAERSVSTNGKIILCADIAQCIEAANEIAPEHLEIHGDAFVEEKEAFTSFGSLFVGENSMESLGDYTAGVNHVLPTGGAARYTSGLSVMNFIRLQTILHVSHEGLSNIGEEAICLANFEGLGAHAKSVEARLKI